MCSLPPTSDFSELIVDSWIRCKEFGLNTSQAPFRQIPDEDLLERLRVKRELIDAAIPHLKWIALGMSGVPFVVYLTDEHGIVLHSIYSDSETARSGAVEPGCDWSEKVMGTNGAGTALATNRPVVIVRHEHYSCALDGWTCTAAPIRTSDGTVVGAVDASTIDANLSPERVVLVSYVAELIGRALATLKVPGLIGAAHIEHSQIQKERERGIRNRERMLAVASHDIRSPLTALELRLRLLEQVASNEVTSKTIRKALGDTRKIADLLKDFLDIALAGEGKLRFRPARVDLAAAIQEAIARASVDEDSPKIILESREPVVGLWDAQRLDQIFSNLIGNAVKHSKASHIQVISEVTEHTAHVQIRDDGVGMSPEIVERVFEPFETTALPDSGSFGLGLWIVRLLVDGMGGKVSVTSALGQGTCFFVELPRGRWQASDV